MIVFASAALAGFFSAQVVAYEPDEVGYTHLAMGIANSLLPFTTRYGGAERLNQLYPLLIAPIWGTFGNVAAFRITHLWNGLLMASAAIPTYLLAREVVARRWPAYLAAALVAAAPWLTLATSQLTEVAAYPACAWALLAMQRSLAVPSPKRDLIALFAIAVAAYGRLQLILLAPVFVLAMLVHEMGYALRRHGERKALLVEAAKRILRGHAVLSVIAITGLAVGLPLLLSGLLANAAGFYGVTLTGVTINGATFDLARSYFIFIALGLGVLPVILAVGFSAEMLVAPRARALHAFASISIVTVLAIIFQVAEISVRLNGGTMQERYVFFIVPLLAVGMCASLLSSRSPAKMTLFGTVVVALLVGSAHYESPTTAFWYQASPGMASFYDWIRPLFGAQSGPMTDPGAARQLLAGVAVLIVGVLIVALLARKLPPARVLSAVGLAVLAFCAVETGHALWRVVHGSANGTGFGGQLHNAEWVDRNVPNGAAVQQLVSSVGNLDSARRVWEDDEFWNRQITGADTLESFSDPYLSTSKLGIDTRTGLLSTANGGRLLSLPYVVLAARGLPLQLAGEVLARSSNGELELVRPVAPLRAAWMVTGVSPDGWLGLSRPALIHFYTLQDGIRCFGVSLELSLSSLLPAPVRVSMGVGAGMAREAFLRPGRMSALQAHVCRSSGGTVPELHLAAEASGLDATVPLSPQLLEVRVTPA